jgi:hypothetical protein
MKSDRFYLATLYHDYAIRTFCHDRNTAELYLHDLPSRNARYANESTYLPSVNKKLTLLETLSSNVYLCSFALSKFVKHHVVFIVLGHFGTDRLAFGKVHNHVYVLYNLSFRPFCFVFIQLVSFLDKPKAKEVSFLSDHVARLTVMRNYPYLRPLYDSISRFQNKSCMDFLDSTRHQMAGLEGIYDPLFR